MKLLSLIGLILIACSASIAYAADQPHDENIEIATIVAQLDLAERELESAQLELAAIMQDVSERARESVQAYHQMEDAAHAENNDPNSSSAPLSLGLIGLSVSQGFALRGQASKEAQLFNDYASQYGPQIRARIAELKDEIADLDLQVIFLRAIVAERTHPKKTQSGPLV